MTTSEEGKKLKNVEPHWQPDGLLNIASERYAKRKETLADVLLLAERLSADNPSDGPPSSASSSSSSTAAGLRSRF